MANQAVENAVCPTCGADLREGALFCYGCGKAVPASASEDPAKTLQFSRDTFAVDVDSAAVPRPDDPKATNGPVTVDAGGPAANGKGLRTASSMRRRPKTPERKNVEVTWASPERPSALFFVVSISLGLAALTLIALALYLR